MGIDLKKINGAKVFSFLLNHADQAVNIVEATKHLFTSGADKKAAAMTIVSNAVDMADFSDEEKALAQLPETQALWSKLIELRVQALKTKTELMTVIDAIKHRGEIAPA